MLNTQRWDWGSSTLHGPQGPLGCHLEWVSPRCSHQGCDCTLSLLWEHFWWPGMTNQIQQSIKSCTCCLQHDGNVSKVPLQLIVATASLDLLHVDFTNIEPTLELYRLPKVVNVLVFKDHFMKHVLVYVTPDQTAKIVAKFHYQGYISIIGAPARLLSDWGATFMSSIIDEMCKLFSVKKLWTTPYHPHMNELVERSHQTIMQMTRKLGEHKKADWPGHLAEMRHAYNATQPAVMGYSPHYLMFGCRPRLLVNFYFPTFRSAEVPRRGTSAKCVDEYVTTVQDWLRATLQETQVQSTAEAQWEKWYFDWKIGTGDLKPGDLVLVMADAFQGKRMIKDRWEDMPHEVVHQITTDVPSYKVTDQCRKSCILHCNWLLLIMSEAGVQLFMGVCQVQDQCTSPTPVKPTPRGSDNGTMPWEDGGLMST